MIKKIMTKVLVAAAGLGLMLFSSCGNLLGSDSLDDGREYGSITIVAAGAQKTVENRAIDYSKLSLCDIYVYSTKDSFVSKKGVSLTGGKNSGTVTIDKIPAGVNRVVKVVANDINATTMYAVIDSVVPGKNTDVAVNWNSTPLGGHVYSLMEKGLEVSDSIKTSYQAKVDALKVHGSCINFESDEPSVVRGTVMVEAAGLSGYTYCISDPASESVSISSDSDKKTLLCAPGMYSVIVYKDGVAVSEKSVAIGDVESDVSTVNLGVGSGIDLSGKTIAFVKADKAPTIWAWEDGGVPLSSKLGGSWGTSNEWTLMKAVTKEYMADPSGWYMMDYSLVASGKAIKFKLNFGGNELDGAAGTFWYNGSASTENPSPTVGGVSITVKSPAVKTKPAVEITPAGGEIMVDGKITVTVDDGNGTLAGVKVQANNKTYSYSDFVSNVLTINVADVAANGETISVDVTAANEKGSVSKIGKFSVVESSNVKIYVSSTSGAPTLWAWTSKVNNITNGDKYPGEQMSNASGLKCNDNWYVITSKLDSKNTDKIDIIINGDGKTISSNKTGTFWYDAAGIGGTLKAGQFYDADPSIKPEPVKPTLKISPATGKEIGTRGSIKIDANFGYDDITENSVTVNGKSFTLKEGTNVIPVSDYAQADEVGKAITVSATLTNSKGTATVTASYKTKKMKEDSFTWDNVNCYFVLTDRFYNGDTSNDHSYLRQNGLSGDEDVATFHGGDLAGLTQKLDYFDKLGVNAIWITAPYEQAHGWVAGKNGKFPHYAFHGYYTLDWSSMDQNMGTVEELREFVNACHSRGIRVVMDVVMNHVGYNNTQDMVTFKHGYTEHTDGWLEKALNPSTGKTEWFANDTVKWDGSYWDSTWFGPWIRSFGYDSGSEYGGSCGGLPDVKTELTESVGLAPVHVTKWNTVDTQEYKDSYYNPSVAATDWLDKNGDYRTDMGVAPADYQVAWLSAWVREVGIDGFRCDTAKHVEPWRWGQLKKACTAALEAWRNDSTKSKLYNGADTGAADWDEAFWMTGEHFGWTSTEGQGDYYTTGGFDSMINFSFNGSQGGGTSSSFPSESTWSSYININKNADSDGNGNRNNVLTYLSSHDTKLCRPSDAMAQGTMFTLTPGGIQIYYGDESSRPQAYTGCGDTDMYTRGDMNWSEISGSKAAQVAHWGKVGNFRKYNPAVGAGTGTATKRSYSGPAGESKVAIGISGASVDVGGLFEDGATVYNWYDGTSAKVSGSTVTFAGGTTSQPILVSDKNPADFGVSF